ncbi:hypothetical protein SteCoe_17244 [Stentor coeruleus]|uniref:Uncharacterized protein n=1 Tax=Stentor coeruleus TaxID=5963 RepID=A0A1R2BZC6_9CILI|nr:hypothetical protein SteCoe_17244 [Stentor coeruleus]
MLDSKIKQPEANFSDISKTIKINNDLNSSSLNLKSPVITENQKFVIEKTSSFLIIPESAHPYRFSKKESMFLRELFIICTIWISVLFYVNPTKNEYYSEEYSEVLVIDQDMENIIMTNNFENDFNIKYDSQCTLV